MTLACNQFSNSLRHGALINTVSAKPKLLIIQDLDGVCMPLVRNPLSRSISASYVRACKYLSGEFYVLTNGEHIGARGVNGIVERAFSNNPQAVRQQGLYLPGLAAGGVQFQDCYGQASHPGVSESEITFLQAAPAFISQRLRHVLAAAPFNLDVATIERLLAVIVLDNALSPTVNIGSLFELFAAQPSLYTRFQNEAIAVLSELQTRACEQGLAESFFVHLAPNRGSSNGAELIKPATASDMGTTDFQFMLRGAIKEVGVLVLLNHYYYEQTGSYPLGEGFNVRNAPHTASALLDLAEQAFAPELMPSIIAVGDTVTSSQRDGAYQRGGSDRGFLRLVQALGERLHGDNAVLFVDSSGGELNRPGLTTLEGSQATQLEQSAFNGISDADDELRFNALFPGGYRQYTEFFIKLAAARQLNPGSRRLTV